MTDKENLYAAITRKIIDDVTTKELTWKARWHADNLLNHELYPRRYNNDLFEGRTAIALFVKAIEKRFTTPYWLTFREVVAFRGRLVSGERPVVFVRKARNLRQEYAPGGEPEVASLPVRSEVFNADQIAGLPPCYYGDIEKYDVTDGTRGGEIELFFKQSGADIALGKRPEYSWFRDRIHMPPFDSFDTPESYYTTLSHELVHWTGHPSRLNREFNRAAKGYARDAQEELVAELGAAFLAAELGLEEKPLLSHSAYIQSWLAALDFDTDHVLHAAEHAGKAIAFIKNIQDKVSRTARTVGHVSAPDRPVSVTPVPDPVVPARTYRPKPPGLT